MVIGRPLLIRKLMKLLILQQKKVLGHASKATSADVDRALKSAEKRIKSLEKNNTVGQIFIF